MRQTWFSPRALLLHLAVVVVAGACLVLAWWQWLRATGGNGLSWAYVFEWPFFAGVAVYVWWDLIHFAHPEAPKGNPADVLPPGWFRAKMTGELSHPDPAVGGGAPAVTATSDALEHLDTAHNSVDAGDPEEWVEVGDLQVLPPDPVHLDPIDLEEAEELEAYNRYLAQLHASGKRKHW